MFFKEQYAQQKLRVTEYLIALPRERESMGVFDNSKVCVCVCVWGGGGGGTFSLFAANLGNSADSGFRSVPRNLPP